MKFLLFYACNSCLEVYMNDTGNKSHCMATMIMMMIMILVIIKMIWTGVTLFLVLPFK